MEIEEISMARTKNFTRYIMCFSLFILGLKQSGHAIFLGLQMLGEASGITGYNFSAQNNVVHPTVVQGAKTTVTYYFQSSNNI